MGDVGAFWDNAVIERFFGSLKRLGAKNTSANTLTYKTRCDEVYQVLQQ